jgi:two-component system, chemotaxis family, sensor kinase CheA
MHALRRQKKSRDLQKATVRETVKIDTERLDRLVDTIGELAIAEAMVGQDEQILATASPEMTKNISRLNKITRQLQEMGMSMRLVPIKGIFQRLSRAVRDLSKKSGKPVNLELSGEDAEVDRSIIESIGDPLMHMVRNSIDHGLETPDERINIGKPKTGTLTLRAFHKGGKICFEIEDDGRGLNRDKILARAIERGLVAKDKEITDREIYNLIFLPGFSTADKISEISGRGVGMDVVKKNIEAMHGHLEIDSRLGRGTRFSIQLPLTLAMIDGMMVGVGGQKFIIPTLSVVESVQLTLKVIKTVAGEGQKLIHRDELLPLFKIRTLFSQERMNRIYSDSTVVIVEDLKRRIGLVVDEVNGQHQFVIKSLGPMFQKQKCISGGAVLSDGTIGLILDIGGIIELAGVDKTFAGVSQ